MSEKDDGNDGIIRHPCPIEELENEVARLNRDNANYVLMIDALGKELRRYKQMSRTDWSCSYG